VDAPLYALLAGGAPLLTSSRRLAHALRADYAAAAQARGISVWQTPQVLPWSTYLRDACLAQRSSSNAGTSSPRFLNDAQTLALWEEIVGASSAGKDLLNPTQAARAAMRSWQRLHQYQIPLAQIAAFPSEEAQTFAAWAQNFVVRTQAQSWLDSARFTTFLSSKQSSPGAHIALSGFDQLTPETNALLAQWRALGCTVDVIESGNSTGLVRVVAAHDADSELDDAARWARAQLDSGKERIAVIVPNLATRVATVRRVFEEVFAPQQRFSGVDSVAQAFSIAASTSLVRYPLAHSALLALQIAQGGADSTVVGQLLRSPFFGGAEAELSERALADVRLRDERRGGQSLSHAGTKCAYRN
jgi:ATP-dependent helicase/nuclease subunit B